MHDRFPPFAGFIAQAVFDDVNCWASTANFSAMFTVSKSRTAASGALAAIVNSTDGRLSSPEKLGIWELVIMKRKKSDKSEKKFSPVSWALGAVKNFAVSVAVGVAAGVVANLLEGWLLGGSRDEEGEEESSEKSRNGNGDKRRNGRHSSETAMAEGNGKREHHKHGANNGGKSGSRNEQLSDSDSKKSDSDSKKGPAGPRAENSDEDEEVPGNKEKEQKTEQDKPHKKDEHEDEPSKKDTESKQGSASEGDSSKASDGGSSKSSEGGNGSKKDEEIHGISEKSAQKLAEKLTSHVSTPETL